MARALGASKILSPQHARSKAPTAAHNATALVPHVNGAFYVTSVSNVVLLDGIDIIYFGCPSYRRFSNPAADCQCVGRRRKIGGHGQANKSAPDSLTSWSRAR